MIVLFFSALVLVAFRPGIPPHPNVVLISIDTLRADHMGCYGYRRGTTPRLDAWARGAVRFDQVTAPANSTLPSHMSMFTSLHPEVHGVVDREEQEQRLTLAPGRVTLAESLRQAGYETAAFVRDCVWMDPRFGLGRGFDSYRVVDMDARRTNEAAVFPWLRRTHEKPFFLFVHYYDAHSDWTRLPYDAPPPFDSLFTAGYRGGFTGCGKDLCATRYLQQLTDLDGDLSKEDLDYIVGLYDNGVAYADSEAGRLVDALGQIGILENTIVILVGDHGEEFREHGCLGHCGLHEDTIRVPWIVSWPGHLAPRTVQTPVQTLDLLPTLLGLLGLPSSGDAQGLSRVDELEGRGQPPQHALFSTVAWGSGHSVRRGRWKLILDRDSERNELYDLEADPGETTNLTLQRPDLADELVRLVSAFREENGRLRAAGPSLDPVGRSGDDAEKLRSLGYAR